MDPNTYLSNLKSTQTNKFPKSNYSINSTNDSKFNTNHNKVTPSGKDMLSFEYWSDLGEEFKKGVLEDLSHIFGIDQIKEKIDGFRQMISAEGWEKFTESIRLNITLDENGLNINNPDMKAEIDSMIQDQLAKGDQAYQNLVKNYMLTKEGNEERQEQVFSTYNDVANVLGVATHLRYVPSETESALITYNDTTHDVLASTTDPATDGKSGVVAGVSKIQDKYVDSINAEIEHKHTDLITHGISSIKFKAIDDPFQTDHKIMVFEDSYPNIYYYYSASGDTPAGYYSLGSDLGFDQTKDFLTNPREKGYLSEKANKASTFGTASSNAEAKQTNYYNSAIKALAQSMPDFSPNMFDVIISVYKGHPELNYSSAINNESSFIHDGDNTIIEKMKDSINGEHFLKFVNTNTFAFRTASISIPQGGSTQSTIAFLNRKIPVIENKSSFKNSSSLRFRADQALFFVDQINAMAGNFLWSPNQNAGTAALHSTFYMPTNNQYFLAQEDSQINKINIYIPLVDTTLLNNSSFINKENSTFANGQKLNKMAVYCLEDVRFLGVDDISLSSGSAGTIEINAPFIFRRAYKFYTDIY